MDKFKMEETDLYRELQSDEEREDYKQSFLKTLSCFAYLEEYGNFDFTELQTLEDIKNLDIEPISKTFFSLVYLKSQIQRDKSVSQGTMNGYYEVIYNHEDTLNIIKNIMMYQDNQNNQNISTDFF